MYNEFRVRTGLKKEELEPLSINQWTEDYKLLDWGPRGLFVEYLEMSRYLAKYVVAEEVYLEVTTSEVKACPFKAKSRLYIFSVKYKLVE